MRGDELGGRRRARRLLDDLLVAALDRAVALEEVHHVACAIAEHLDLDVARADDRLLEVDGVVAEGLRAALARALPRARDLVFRVRRGACPCRRRRPPP